MYQLEILRGEEVVHTHPISAQPCHLGRGTTNDLVLADARVSSNHLVVWTEGDSVWLEDLGSRNGTTLDGTPLTGRREAGTGALVVMGGNIHMRISGTADPRNDLPGLLLEDTHSGVRVPIRSDRLVIGSDPGCALVIPEAAPQAATLLIHPGEVWLGTNEDTSELTIDHPFEVAGRTLVLRAAGTSATRTEALDEARYPYSLTVQMDGPAGPAGRLKNKKTGVEHLTTSEIRATLLFVLARQLRADLDSGEPPDERGWMHDDDIASGIWGRERFRLEPNNFHVLVHRLRKEVKGAGFDPWFIEKKRLHLRLKLDDVTIG